MNVTDLMKDYFGGAAAEHLGRAAGGRAGAAGAEHAARGRRQWRRQVAHQRNDPLGALARGIGHRDLAIGDRDRGLREGMLTELMADDGVWRRRRFRSGRGQG